MIGRYLLGFLLPLSVVCGRAQSGTGVLGQLGEFAIGSSPMDLKALLTTDCIGSVIDLSDCSGVGENKVRYTFFDGALSRVSANRREVEGNVKLPGHMAFGESIATAAAKLGALKSEVQQKWISGMPLVIVAEA